MTPQLNSQALWKKLMSNFVRVLNACVIILCFQQTQNVRFYVNLNNFTLNFLSRGQHKNLFSIHSSYLYSKYNSNTRLWGCFGNLIFAIIFIAWTFCEKHILLSCQRKQCNDLCHNPVCLFQHANHKVTMPSMWSYIYFFLLV